MKKTMAVTIASETKPSIVKLINRHQYALIKARMILGDLLCLYACSLSSSHLVSKECNS